MEDNYKGVGFRRMKSIRIDSIDETEVVQGVFDSTLYTKNQEKGYYVQILLTLIVLLLENSKRGRVSFA